MGCAAKIGADKRCVVERVVRVGFGDEETLRRGRGPRPTKPCKAGAGTAHKRQLGGAVLACLPGRTFTPPVTVERDVPRVVRDDAVRVVPVDLAVAVHVGVCNHYQQNQQLLLLINLLRPFLSHVQGECLTDLQY